jgi:hypothetical protein
MQGLLATKKLNYFSFNEEVVHDAKCKNPSGVLLIANMLHLRNSHRLVCRKWRNSNNKRKISSVITGW